MGNASQPSPRACRGLVFGFFAPRAPGRGSGGNREPFQQRTWAQRGRCVWGQLGLGGWPRAHAPPWGRVLRARVSGPTPQAPS